MQSLQNEMLRCVLGCKPLGLQYSWKPKQITIGTFSCQFNAAIFWPIQVKMEDKI